MFQSSRLRTPVTVVLMTMLIIGSFNISYAGTEYPKPDEYVPVDVQPSCIHREIAKYPRQAAMLGLEGTAWVKALVDTSGNVVKTKIARTSGIDALDKAALKSAEKSKYKPAIFEEKPVAYWVCFKVEFNLDDTKDKYGKTP